MVIAGIYIYIKMDNGISYIYIHASARAHTHEAPEEYGDIKVTHNTYCATG
jgi:hypothetical protein